jgi:D-alanine-D-alanine ligase
VAEVAIRDPCGGRSPFMQNVSSRLTSGSTVILCGGDGSERFVSVATAQNLCKHLPEAALWFWRLDGAFFEVSAEEVNLHARPFEVPFEPSGHAFASSLEEALSRARSGAHALVLALHGACGEDGNLSARCEELGIAFTGSGSAASRIAFDKASAKRAASGQGVPMLPSTTLGPDGAVDATATRAWLEQFGTLVAKPVADGSSHGLRFLEGQNEYEAFLSEPRAVPFLLEPFAQGTEATVAVIDHDAETRALPPVEIHVPSGASFDYARKYLDTTVIERCPSGFAPAVDEALKQAALSAHRAIGCFGYSRSDFIVRADGSVVFLELNTLPGMTVASLLPRALAASNIALRDFLHEQVALARARRDR